MATSLERICADPLIDISPLTLGCWNFADPTAWGDQDESEAVATIHEALDRGINCFDTASLYGDGASEELLGRALSDRRERAIVATKVARWHLPSDQLRESCEGSLRRLKMDVIDLFQVHWPSREVPMEETIETLNALRDEGKIRAFGVCNFGRLDLAEWIEKGGALTTNQVAYSLLSRGVEAHIVPGVLNAGMKLLCYSPLMQGLLTGRYVDPDTFPEQRARSRHFHKDRPLSRHGEEGFEEETFAVIRNLIDLATQWELPLSTLSLRWLIQKESVGSVIFGARSREQLQMNLKAFDVSLSSEQMKALDVATDGLKKLMGSEPDIWQNPSRMR